MANETEAARTIKRRGILAAAGAVVTGIAAKQTAQPAGATSGTGTDGNLVLGSNSTDNTANYTSLRTEVISGLSFHGQVLLDCSASPFQSSGDANTIGISGVSRGTAAGVYGSDYVGSKPPGYPAGMNAGIYGYTYTQGHSGVRGDGGPYGTGVLGGSVNGFGLYGISSTGIGCWGESDGAGGTGVYGYAPGSAAIGLTGYGPAGIGVYGVTNSAGNYGVLGTAGGTANSTGVAGTATGNGASAFSGGNSNPNGFAAYFDGHVQVNGPFDVIGAGNKHAAVAHPDGSHRTIYSIEAAEAWIEDFGTGTLMNGTAAVKLDADFAALIHIDTYHVFLSEYDDHNLLYATQRTASSFAVRAKSGAINGTFSWRVVARPKTTAKVERLAKVNIADAKALLPDPAKLPKPQKPLDMPQPTQQR